MNRASTAAVAALSLVLGFAAVQVTDAPWLGGAVVLVGAVWCVVRESGRTRWWRIGAVLVAGAACFVASHALADVVGAWPSVGLAAAALAAVTWSLVERTPRADE